MSWWSWMWVIWGLSFFAIEVPGIVLNNKHDKIGDIPREHRTLTENLRWLFATDKDSARARWRGLRRFALLAGIVWLGVHIAVVNWV
jgi:hypothetical protein